MSNTYNLIRIHVIAVIVVLGLFGCGKEEPRDKTVGKDAAIFHRTSTTTTFGTVSSIAPVAVTAGSSTTVLAVIGDKEKPVASRGPSSHAAGFTAHGKGPSFSLLFAEKGGSVVYSAQQGGKSYIVHNGKRSPAYSSLGDFAISADGRRVIYGVPSGGKWRMVVNGMEGKLFDEVGTPVFSPDGNHVAYEARVGDRWHVVVDTMMSSGCESFYEKPVFSADSTKVFLIENTADVNTKRLIVSDLSFAQPHVYEFKGSIIQVSDDRTRVAGLYETDGKKKIIEFTFSDPSRVKESPLYEDIALLSFGTKRNSLAYAIARQESRFLVLDGKEEKLPEGFIQSSLFIRPDGKGLGIFLGPQGAVYLHQAFVATVGKAQSYDEAAELVYDRSGSHYAYTARKGKRCFVVVDGKEGPRFDMVVSPRYSPDGRFLVYRARKNDKRFVVIADPTGKVVKQLPAFDMVFDTVFTSDGKSIGYGVKDGKKLIWKVDTL